MRNRMIRSVLLLLLLSGGCNRGGKGDRESVLDTVQRTGEVVVGIGEDAAPFGMVGPEGLTGFDVEIARAVVRGLGRITGREMQIRFRPVTDETRIGWVRSGEVHMSLCHTNITRKRDGVIDFSVPYMWDGKGILYDRRGGPRDLADFAGKKVGIKRSSSSEGEIQAWFDAQGFDLPLLRVYDNHAAGIQALVDGQIDGFTDDNSIIINTAMRAGHRVGPEGVLAVTETAYSPAYFGIGVPENDSDWRDAVNYALHDLWTSGEYHRIYDKWFGPDSMCPIPLGPNRMWPFVIG